MAAVYRAAVTNCRPEVCCCHGNRLRLYSLRKICVIRSKRGTDKILLLNCCIAGLSGRFRHVTVLMASRC